MKKKKSSKLDSATECQGSLGSSGNYDRISEKVEIPNHDNLKRNLKVSVDISYRYFNCHSARFNPPKNFKRMSCVLWPPHNTKLPYTMEFHKPIQRKLSNL